MPVTETMQWTGNGGSSTSGTRQFWDCTTTGTITGDPHDAFSPGSGSFGYPSSGGQLASGCSFTFASRGGHPRVIDGFRFQRVGSTGNGETFEFWGSNDGFATHDVLHSFVFATSSQEETFTNSTPYLAYRFQGISTFAMGNILWQHIDLHIGFNQYEWGDRRSVITGSGYSGGAGTTVDKLLDGNLGNGTGTAMIFDGGSNAGKNLLFAFDQAVFIARAYWMVDQNGGTNGVWRWEGSNDAGATWTTVKSDFTMTFASTSSGPASEIQEFDSPGSYNLYRMLGISGSSNGGVWYRETDFELVDAAVGPSIDVAGATTGRFQGSFSAVVCPVTSADDAILIACMHTETNAGSSGPPALPTGITSSTGLTWVHYSSRDWTSPNNGGSHSNIDVWYAWAPTSGTAETMTVATDRTFDGCSIVVFAAYNIDPIPFDTHPSLDVLNTNVTGTASIITSSAFSTYADHTLAVMVGANADGPTNAILSSDWEFIAGVTNNSPSLWSLIATQYEEFTAPASSEVGQFNGGNIYNYWGAQVFALRALGTEAPPVIEYLVAPFVDEDGFTATPTMTVPPDDLSLVAAFSDDGDTFLATPTLNEAGNEYLVAPFVDDGDAFLATPTLNANRVHPVVAFTDDGDAFLATPTINASRVHPTAQFTDDGGFRALPTINPVDPGPFYFAWAESGQEWSSGAYGKQDEDVFSFSIKQTEGDFAEATFMIRNPRIGLLNPSRKRWAFFSVRQPGADELTPLFYGRLQGIPSNMFDTLVTLTFIARPFDYDARKTALANTLRNRPYWDSLFLKPDLWADDDTVLEARTAQFHTDRVTHEVTISDIIDPEDGVIEFTESQIVFDSVGVSLADAPLRTVTIQSTIPWTQTSARSFNISPYLSAKAIVNGRINGEIGGLIETFTFDGLQSDWPDQGSKIGTGWVVAQSDFTNVVFTAIPKAAIPDYFDTTTIPTIVAEGSILFPVRVTSGEYHAGESAGFSTDADMVIVPIGGAFPRMAVSYAIDREMSEAVSFTMSSDVQDVLTLAPESDNRVITVDANKASDPDYDGTIPLGDLESRSFVDTPRGRQAVEHLMLIARANLASAARVVSTGFTVSLWEGIPATLRKGAHVHDRRFPSGELVGKIVDYELSLDGSSGSARAIIKIMSTVGRGGSYEAVEGEPTWADADYIGDDYQEFAGGVDLVAAQTDFTYTIPAWQPFDDGVDFKKLTPLNIIQLYGIANNADDQRQVLLQYVGGDQGTISSVLQDIPTRCTLKLLPLRTGPFAGAVPISVVDLVLPKQIDLEAESND